ncbi:MAG: hypothetical protein GXP27_05675, partial [Planctomycetes bacterium]|nr:hypothetical protein [Planctomycetota bacterium]
SNEPGQQTIYRNKGTRQQVRIFLYDTDRPGQCLSRLAGTVHLDDHHFLTPDQTFDTEGMVGVVVPLLPKSAAAAIPTLVWEVEGVAHSAAGKPRSAVDGREQTHGTRCPEGEAAYQFVTRVITLCEQLKDLHRLGIYHGTVNPLNTWWYEDNWIIDQVWVGALIGLADPVSVFPEGDVSVGFLAPEILAWQSPPQLSSDIYGIGALLYGILTGTTPMDPSAARTLMRGGQPPPFRAGSAIRDAAPNVSRRLQDIIVKALQPDPARRHRTVDELANELAQCQWPRDMVLTLIERAHDYQKRGLIVEAYDALDEALRYEPGSPEVHHARAEIYFLEGEIVWALKENTKALEILPTASALFLQGQCLIAQKRYVEAQDCVRAGLDVEDCSRGHHLLAQCLEGSGLPLAAVSEYEEAVKHAELKKDDRLAEQIRSDLSALRSKIKDWHPDKP